MSKVEKSFQTLGLADGILDGVVTCLIEAEKKAKSSREIQTLDVNRRGLRQDIYVGKLMVIPHQVMDDTSKIPDPLLKGAVLRLFDGEEAACLEAHRLSTNEFDDLSDKDITEYKDKVFRDDTNKLGCVVIFQPAWANFRDYHAFRFTKDVDKLKLLVRHLVFSAYYNPSLSALFDTLTEDAVKLDAENITHEHLGPAYEFKGEEQSYPVLDKGDEEKPTKSKKGGLKKRAEQPIESAVMKLSPDVFIQSYLEAAVWTGTDDDGSPLDNDGKFSINDFSPDSLRKAEEDCTAFVQMAGDTLQPLDDSRAGFLFWLNRNGHGSGFWDEETLDEASQKKLDTLAHSFGECDLYVSDDGELELTGGHIPAPPPAEGSGHVLPVNGSAKLRFASCNLGAIRAAKEAPEERAVFDQLEIQIKKKLGSAGFDYKLDGLGATLYAPNGKDVYLQGEDADPIRELDEWLANTEFPYGPYRTEQDAVSAILEDYFLDETFGAEPARNFGIDAFYENPRLRRNPPSIPFKGTLLEVKSKVREVLAELGQGWTVKARTDGEVIYSEEWRPDSNFDKGANVGDAGSVRIPTSEKSGFRAQEDDVAPTTEKIALGRSEFKVTFEDGNTLTTGFNGTLADAHAYYVGHRFNFGDTAAHPADRMVRAVAVEQHNTPVTAASPSSKKPSPCASYEPAQNHEKSLTVCVNCGWLKGDHGKKAATDDSGSTTGLRQQPDYGESDSYTAEANDQNAHETSRAQILTSALLSRIADNSIHNGYSEMRDLFCPDPKCKDTKTASKLASPQFPAAELEKGDTFSLTGDSTVYRATGAPVRSRDGFTVPITRADGTEGQISIPSHATLNLEQGFAVAAADQGISTAANRLVDQHCGEYFTKDSLKQLLRNVTDNIQAVFNFMIQEGLIVPYGDDQFKIQTRTHTEDTQKLGLWNEDEDDGELCPNCLGPGTELGTLGSRKHFRCRDCGMEYSTVTEKTAAGQLHVPTYSIETWFERDRAFVGLKRDDKYILEWWDDRVQEAVDDGFLSPKDWLGSAVSYAKDQGLIKSQNPKMTSKTAEVAQETKNYRDGYSKGRFDAEYDPTGSGGPSPVSLDAPGLPGYSTGYYDGFHGLTPQVSILRTANSKMALTYMHPGQVLEQFYPEVLKDVSNYPQGYAERNYTPPPLPLELRDNPDNAQVTTKDYDDQGMKHPKAEPGLIPSQDADSIPLKPNERSIRGPFFSDQFYRIHTDISPALLTMKSSLENKTAAAPEKSVIIGEFLRKLAGEIASSLLAAFIVTDRPLFTGTPAYSSISLLNEGDCVPMNPILTTGGLRPYAAQLKALLNAVNDGELADAINDAWAQGGVWHGNEGSPDRWLYEIFVRIESVDVESLEIRYKYVTGIKE